MEDNYEVMMDSLKDGFDEAIERQVAMQEIPAYIDQLRAQLAEARKDSERLDWLEKMGFLTTHRGDVDRPRGVHKWGPNDSGESGWTARFVSSEFSNARAAIDAAMEGE